MAAADNGAGEAAVRETAARIAAQVENIRRVLRESVWARARDHSGSLTLTAPQVHALTVLVEQARQAGTGLSLSDLAEKMGLAHSTVSGIVSRLERDGLLRRTTRPDDRRYTRIELTQEARQWVDQEIPAARHGPIETVIRKATSEELTAILNGLATLERLLPSAQPHPRDGA